MGESGARTSSRRAYNRNNQSTSSMDSSSGTAVYSSVSSATPSSSTRSSRPCSCSIGACGHATPTTNMTNTSSPNFASSSIDAHTGQTMIGGGQRTQSRNSTMSLATTPANNQLDHKSTPGVDQSAPQAPPPPPGQCRICRKTIEPSEPCHLCSNCNQFICDDCASYSASDQFWMCSSCRRRAQNPAIPAEALKELGLNQNSSAVRRMTLRLNQNELKMAVNKCSSESQTSNQAKATSQTATPIGFNSTSQQRGQPLTVQQQQLILRRQSLERRATLDGEQLEAKASDQRISHSAATAAHLSRQNSLGPQQQQQLQAPGRRSSHQPQQQPMVTSKPSVSAKQQQQRPAKAFQQQGQATTSQQKQQPPASGQSRSESSSADASPLMRSASRQRCKSGGESLKRNDSVQKGQKGAAQKTMSQPTATSSKQLQGQHQTDQFQRSTCVQPTQSQWQEPEVKRVPSIGHQQRRESLHQLTHQQLADQHNTIDPNLMQQQQQQMVGVQQQWPSQAGYLVGGNYLAGQETSHFEQMMPRISGDNQQQQQLIRNMMQNHRNSLAFTNSPSQKQQQFNESNADTCQMPYSMDSSRRSSYASQQRLANMSQLIPIPAEQMHLRRLSDQSNLVRRSSIIASNYFDGTMIARNRSHSNIDSVHYLQQQHRMGSSRTYLNDSSSSFADHNFWHPAQQANQQQRPTELGVAAYELNSSSATNLNYLQPNQQQQVLQQRRLSDGGQYFSSSDQQQKQQIASVVTSYAQKQQQRRRRQSSEEVHSDSSSDLDQSGAVHNYTPAAMDYQDESYVLQQQQQQPITIPSVSVSEFAAAAARRRSSIHMQQQDVELMANYQHDNEITPMQINVAIEQVIQQQQQEQLVAPNGRQDAQFLFMARRGSSSRVLPCIPGGQSRSLLELPLNGGGEGRIGGQNGQHYGAGQSGGSGANSGQGHTRNNSTAGLNHSTLGLPCLSPTIRRASAPEGQIIKIVVDDIDSSLPFAGRHPQNGMKHHQFGQHLQAGNFYERHILYRDDSLDPNGNHVGRGFGLQVMGGKLDADGKLQACVKWVLQGGPADKVGIRPGDKLIEWDGKCLVDMSYEQVAEIIESSANIAEVLVKPKPQQRLYDPEQPPANYVRSQRRLSQQTERDLRRHNQPVALKSSGQQQRRMSCAVQSTGVNELGRIGTGRRLPQIPPTLHQMEPNPSQLVVGPTPMRHASTGQLDQNSQAANGGMFMGHTSQHNRLGLHDLDPQQQSRSASELHRGSIANLNAQARASFSKSNEASVGNMLEGGWMQAQQHGGSQQMMPNSGPYVMNHHDGYAINPNQAEPSGLIGLQVNVDERLATLEISILSAHNIVRDSSLDYVVKVRILPENNRFKVQRMALEIGIWVYDEAPRLSAQLAQPICEALIPIQSARERNIDFWPLRPPLTSPQTRRKSLNDLMGNHYNQNGSDQNTRLMAGPKLKALINSGQESPSATNSDKRVGSFGSLARVSSAGLNDSPKMGYQRERSSSIRNLPDKSQIQPRRASDEVATSSSHRLVARLSPAVSRRSISVMNVGDGYSGGRAARSPVSRLGSQANILKAVQMRRDSGQIL